MQADDLLALSTVVICPTSQSAPAASFHPAILIGEERTLVLCEMVGAVDARFLAERVAHLGLEELREIDHGLQLVLDLA